VRKPFAEAVVQAGSIETLVARLREGRAFAWATDWRTWPGGDPVKLDPSIPQAWWAEDTVHDIDPAEGRAVFKLGLAAFAVGSTVTYEVLALGIEIDDGTAATVPDVPRHAGGRDPDNDWEGAVGHVNAWVHEHGPLPRNRKGEPVVARAVDLMAEWFKANEAPPPPARTSFYRWLRKNPHPEWWL
jgi:hypothetical protein